MDRFDLHDLYRPALCAMFALTVFACEGGGCSSCEGCGVQPIPGAYPLEHRIENSAQVRLTQSGLDFVEENITGIVGTFLPDGLDVDIPRTEQSGFTVCPDSDCRAHAEILSLELTPVDPNKITGHLRLHMDSRDLAGGRAPIPVHNDSFTDITCLLDVDVSRGSRPHVGLVADVAFVAETEAAREGYTRVEIESVALAEGEGIESADLDISADADCPAWNPTCWDDLAACNAADLDFVKQYLIEQLTEQLGSTLNETVNEQLCQSRGEFGCPTGTFSVPDEDPASTCRFENDPEARCVPILLGTDGRGDLGGALLGGFSPGTHAYAQFLLASGGEGEAVNDGMSLFFHGGFMGMDRNFESTPAHHSCVPMIEPPPLPNIVRVDAFRGNVIPGTSTETHVGMGVSEDYLNYAGYGIFDSGMLCIGAGTRLSQQLSTGLVSAAIMSLPALTFPDRNVPLTIAVRPQQPPQFTIGSGESDDPLLQILLPQVEIDFYVWSTERYVRFMTFRTDLGVGVNLTVESNQLVPEIDYLTASDSSVLNSELLQERPEALAATLETLVSTIAGMLGSSLSPFDLPDIMGFQLEVPEGGLTRVQDGGETFLGIYANLSLASTSMPVVASVQTDLELTDLELDRRSMNPEHWNEGLGNRVWLHFGSEGPRGVEYEYSYRIDGGLWSPWTTDERVHVDDDVLLLQARHVVEARARVRGEPESVDPSPAVAELVVDILPPSVSVARTVEGVEVHAEDIISPAGSLEYRYQIDGTWTAWSSEARRAVAVEAEAIVVEVRDESGNVGRSRAALIRGLPNSEASGDCGCRAVGRGGGELPLPLLGLLAGLGLAIRRRRRGRAGRKRAGRGRAKAALGAAALLLIAALASGCQCSSTPCDGLCIHARAPATTGSVCCEATNMCADYDVAELCDPGYTCTEENLVADDTCTVSCLECEPKPALSRGVLATHLDAVVDASGTVHISGYNPGDVNSEATYGDLVFGTWSGGEIEWEVVDGAPSTPITNDPNGWRGGVRDPGEDVGHWTSLVDQGGTFLIAYHDVTNRDLELAAGGPGAWATHTIDDAGDSGRYASLVVDEAGIPIVAYLRIQESPDSPGQIVSSVMVASANLANPSMPTDWTLTEVASGPMACRAQFCPSGTQCLEQEGLCVMPTSDCADECASGTVCFNGSCRATLPPGYVEDLPPAYGLYTSLATTPAGGLALVFYDRSSGNLRGVHFDGSAWGSPFLIDGYEVGDPFTGDSGMSADLVVDAAGLWHVAYVDGAEETLRYAQVQSDGTVDLREVVDDGSTDGRERHSDGRHIVGDDASLVVLEDGGVRIVYQDATAQNAVVAVRGPAGGGWAIQHFDTAGSTGYWLEQELVGTSSYAVTWWREREGRSMTNGTRVLVLE